MKARYLLVSLLILALDQWTKWLVELKLPLHQSHVVLPGFFDLTHVQNTGVAFGLFASQGDGTQTAVLTGLGLLALAVVLFYMIRTDPRERMLLLALALILGGAVGNLADRIASGAVTDFLDFYVGSYHWHTFNVADSAITSGLVLMILDSLWPRKKSPADSGSTGEEV
jgi:signal peptidase II